MQPSRGKPIMAVDFSSFVVNSSAYSDVIASVLTEQTAGSSTEGRQPFPTVLVFPYHCCVSCSDTCGVCSRLPLLGSGERTQVIKRIQQALYPPALIVYSCQVCFTARLSQLDH